MGQSIDARQAEGREMTDLLEKIEGFVTQDDMRSAYISAVCRVCKMHWLGPRDPRRRARGALLTLAEHQEQHGDDSYDASDDMRRSLEECYREIRKRKARGG